MLPVPSECGLEPEYLGSPRQSSGGRMPRPSGRGGGHVYDRLDVAFLDRSCRFTPEGEGGGSSWSRRGDPCDPPHGAVVSRSVLERSTAPHRVPYMRLKVTSSPAVNGGASTTGGIPRLSGIEVSRRVRVTGLRLRPRSHRWRARRNLVIESPLLRRESLTQ